MAKRSLKTDAQLVKEGYHHTHTKRCSYGDCTAQIEIWRTPKGRLMPFDRVTVTADEARAAGIEVTEHQVTVSVTEPHFGSCKGLSERNRARSEGRDQEGPEPEKASVNT